MDWEHTRKSMHAADSGLEEPMDGTPERIGSVYRERSKKRIQAACSSPTGTRVLVFRLGKERYGIELASAGAVLGAMPITPVPEAEDKLEGLVNVNGTIRPVLNLRFLLNLPPAAADTPQCLLLGWEQRELGIQVEEIERISDFVLSPAVTDGATKYIHGATAGSLTTLRISALFAELWDERSVA
jgi:chemotaxis signal transduction protein